MSSVPSVLFRYSERVHLDSFLKCGGIRLRPASYYRDSALTDAQQDDELARRIRLNPDKHRLLVSRADGPPRGLDMLQKIEVTLKMVTKDGLQLDYYLFCTSLHFDKALYPSFDADACVRITEPKVFAERIYAACKETFKECVMYFDPVMYYDPEKPLVVTTIKDLMFHKDADKYPAQAEYRFAIALRPTEKLHSTCDIKIGSLTDIAAYEGE